MTIASAVFAAATLPTTHSRLPARLLDGRFDLAGRDLVNVIDDDVSAGCREAIRDGTADAETCAGDNRDPAL